MKRLWVISFLVQGYFLSAQTRCDLCQKEVLELSSYMQLLEQNKEIGMETSVTSSWLEKGKRMSSTEDFSITRSKNYVFNKSSRVEYYVDKHNSYVVLHSQKQIRKTNFSLDEMKKGQLSPDLGNDVSKMMVLDSCAEQEMRIWAKYKVPAKTSSTIKSITVECDSALKPKHMIFDYSANGKRVMVNFISIQIKQASSLDAKSQLFDKQGKLKKRFEGYTFKDYSDAKNQ